MKKPGAFRLWVTTGCTLYRAPPLWSGSHDIQRSKIARALAIWPIISSMWMYLYQNVAVQKLNLLVENKL